MTRYYLAVGLLALLNLAAIGLCLWLFQRVSRLEKRLAGRVEDGVSPSTAPPRTVPSAAPFAKNTDFASSLMGSEMQRRLQEGGSLREPPEKYRFVASLAGQGMPAAEIARALHLAPGEVEQLISLARISGLAGGGGNSAEEKPKETGASDRKG